LLDRTSELLAKINDSERQEADEAAARPRGVIGRLRAAGRVRIDQSS
jgi:hypothetical protein